VSKHAETARAHLELRPAGNVNSKMKVFCKYISSKMKAEENYYMGFKYMNPSTSNFQMDLVIFRWICPFFIINITVMMKIQ